MKESGSNPEYQELLQRYHELKEKIENLGNDRTLFEHEIILDSGTVIHPSYTSAFFRCKEEKNKILEQLKLFQNYPEGI